MIALFSTLVCLIFTGACGLEFLQRSADSDDHTFNLFTSLYFVVATFSTVGYGDVFPSWWVGRLYVIILIIWGISVLPKRVSSLHMRLVQVDGTIED